MSFVNRFKKAFGLEKKDNEESNSKHHNSNNEFIMENVKLDKSNEKDSRVDEAPDFSLNILSDEIEPSSNLTNYGGWKYAVIFISSTFNDMHAERDYLIKEVFPELSGFFEKHKIRLIDVDLRWGIREEESKNKTTLGTCLHNIDRSRPFFVCFLGQRRGWVPDFDNDIDDTTKKEYPQIKEMSDKSITEMEIEHSLLSPLCEMVDNKQKRHDSNRYSLFFFRDDDYVDNLSPAQRLIYTNDNTSDIDHANEKLNETKEKIYKKELSEAKENETRLENEKIHIGVFKYSGTWDSDLEIPELNHFKNQEWKGGLTDFICGSNTLKDVLTEELKKQIFLEFPENREIRKLTDFEENLDKEEIFCYLNSEGCIPRPEYSEKLYDFVNDSDNGICLVHADAGYGKTMLLSNFSLEFQSKFSNKRLYKRFCGASNFSLNAYSLWKSIIDEAGISNDSIFYPNNFDELKINFERILEAISDNEDSVIVIDAINQMADGVDMLGWLGKYDLPDNLKIIISVKNESFRPSLIKKFYGIEIQGLDEQGKRRLISQYLSNYLKALDENQIDAICEFEASKNPLFLKILLSELRVFGSFEQLNEKIEKFGNSPVSAFKHVLEGLEADEKKTNIVPLIFSLLANARNGLSEDELAEIIKNQTELDYKTIEDTIRLNMMKIRQFMMKRDGCHDFFYDSFKIASREKYGDNNDLLLDYFRQKADPSGDYSFFNPDGNNLRALNELPFHLNLAGDYEVLKNVLSSYSFIRNKLELSNIYNLISNYHFGQDHEFLKVDNHPVVLIGNALELSSSVLKNHKNQLPAQLWGRLEGIENKVIKDLLDELIIKTDNLWFKSKGYSLYSPDSPIVKKLDFFDDEKSVTSMVFFPDKKIIWGNDEGTLNMYDLNENHYEVLSKKDSKIVKILLNDDLELFVAYSNGIIKKWDINNKMVVDEYPMIDVREITDIHYSSMYEKLFVCSHEGIFSIDLKTFELRMEDIEVKNYNQFLIPKKLGYILVCDEMEVDGWDIYDMRRSYYKRFRLNEGSPQVVDTTYDITFMAVIERFLILISRGGEQKIWDMLKSSDEDIPIDVRHTLSSFDGFKKAVAFEDSHRIMLLSEMGCLNFWNLPILQTSSSYSVNQKQKINEIQTGIPFPSAIAEYWCGEEDWVAIGNEKNEIYIVDLDKSYYYKKHNGAVIAIIIHEDDVISCCEDGEFYIWDFNNEEFKSEFSNDLRVSSVSYDLKNNRMVSAGSVTSDEDIITDKINILDLADGKIEEYMSNDEAIRNITQNSSNIVWIDGNKLMIGADEIKLDKEAISVASHFKYYDVFVGFDDGSIVKYPDEIRFDKTIGLPIEIMKIIEDKLIVGYLRGFIEIFDLNGNHLNTLNGHEDRINDICLFEKYLITASMDNTLRLWDFESNDCKHVQFLDIPATAINVKNQKLVLGDSLGNVRFFNFENIHSI